MMEPQEEYVKSLKQIKEAEDRVQEEVEAHRKLVQEELQNLQFAIEAAVEAARKEGERMVEMEVEGASRKAQIEEQRILDNAREKAAKISTKRVDTNTARSIIEEVLLSHL